VSVEKQNQTSLGSLRKSLIVSYEADARICATKTGIRMSESDRVMAGKSIDFFRWMPCNAFDILSVFHGDTHELEPRS
jgi:hypothetical protein